MFRCIIFAALGAGILAQSTDACRFKNGTALPSEGFYDWYQPCPGSSVCCALNRDNAPGGNVSLGLTRDECLPNGLCQNRATGRKVATQWWVNYCTELDWHGGKCMDICPAGITEVMSCDGTATSERWCCGTSTDCCSTNFGVVTLKQVFGDKSSTSSASASSILTSFTPTSSTSTAVPSQTTPSATAGEGKTKTSAPDTSLRRNNAGVIAGAVIATAVGVAVLFAGFYFAQRRSRQRAAEKRFVETKVVKDSMLVEACAMSQRYELSPSAPKNDIQELPGIEPGDLPAYSMRA